MMPGASPSGWRSLRWPLLLMVVALVGLGLLGNQLIREHVRAKLAMEQAQQEHLAAGGVRTAAQIVERTLDLARTVHSVASLARNDRLHGDPQNALPVEAILAELAREERSGILQIAMIDEEGVLTFSSVPDWQPIDLSDREHFRVHREGLRTPYVSVPLVGRASGRWSVQLTQAILCDRTGAFAGVVVVSVDPLAISAALRHSQFGTEAYTTLLRADGTVLARNTEPETKMGRRLSDAAHQRLMGAPEGVAAMTSPFTGAEMTVAWRQLGHWPMVVAHGLPREPLTQKAESAEAQLRLELAMGLGGLAALGAAGLLWVARRRTAAAAAQAEASRREMADLVGALPGAAYRGLALPGHALLLIQVTDGLARMTGRERGPEASRLDWDPLLDEEGRQARAENIASAIARRESVGEYRLRHAAGHWIWVRDHVRARQHAARGDTELVGVLSDITQERQMAAQAIATSKLATLGEMATGLAHELNQPASAIALAADLASMELDSQDPVRQRKGRARLDLIIHQIMRMREIVQHFQIFARTDPQSTKMEAISVEEAVEGALGLVHGTLNASGVALDVEVPPGLPRVVGQLVPLEQALVNLLLNARDAMEAMPPGARKVRIRAGVEVTPGQGDTVRICVTDSGPGFSPEQLARALEPFYTTKAPGKGTGLGLAIVYGTMRAFGGQVTLGNGPAGGAELTLQLGIAPQAEDGATDLPEPTVGASSRS
jgi:PAS domain S-box-containing protein